MRQLFAADDKFPDVVAELEARGWRRLPFVGCPKFDLKWTNYGKISWGRVTSQQIVNHLQHSIILSQKDQLTQLLYTQEHGEQTQVDRCFPRTFDLSQSQDRRLLKIWFHYSQAVAVLKKSLNESVEVDEAQVGAAMKLIRAVIASDDFFGCWRKEETLLSIDSGVEIVPLDCDRRRKVEEALAVESVPRTRHYGQETGTERQSRTKWIVQKYIERPLLLQNGRKFDIRQWVLITELEPKPTAFCNYSVQQYFVSEEASDMDQKGYELTADHRDESLDQFEPMLSSEQFRDTLKHEHGRDVWNEAILPQMQSIARLTLDAALPKLKAVGRGFEWLGFDFLVDENHHVWLLEVNVSPDVSHSTRVTAELVPKATADMLNVILDTETSRSPDNGWLPFSLQSQQ
ncbi:hypothetical protein PI124_g10170 [Phytophthora idaei]|nr:hypothetical protein PI125_g9793 [Phytophthora idaei]KAG3245080.1 hypothetical protein PI124_g10170 [Phytophthora idaei]